MSIRQDIQLLDPGALVELFELDAAALGGSISYFHAGTNSLRQSIVWQGNTYSPWPIKAEGFEYNGRGQLPTPRVRVANIGGVMTALALAYEDLVGAKMTRRRTLARYLDGQPLADPAAGLPDDIYYVERKVSENRVFIEWELSSVLDVEGIMLPRRQVLGPCGWIYRGAECGYAGGPVADRFDVPTADSNLDDCSKTVVGCKYRFGQNGELPHGGFPGSGKY